MTKFIVKTDGFNWFTPTGVLGTYVRNRAYKGQEIELDEALLTSSQLACLAVPGSTDAAGAEAEANELSADTWRQLSDEELATLGVEQIVAYLNAAPEDLHDSETERVVEIEETRDRPRKGVLELADTDDDGS